LVAAWAKKQTLGPALDALGLRRGATLDEAKAAYRSRVREVHPDRDPSPEAADRYQLLTQSYEFVTRELGPGGGGSTTGLGATIDFAASMFGFAQSVVADVAMPLAGAVANVAVDGRERRPRSESEGHYESEPCATRIFAGADSYGLRSLLAHIGVFSPYEIKNFNYKIKKYVKSWVIIFPIE
jgi:hypothetical protein